MINIVIPLMIWSADGGCLAGWLALLLLLAAVIAEGDPSIIGRHQIAIGN